METLTDYTTFKKSTLAHQPVATKCLLGDVAIEDENTLSYKGHSLYMNRKVIHNLMEILRVPPKFIKEFEELNGSGAKDKFLNFIKNAKAAQENLVVTLVGNSSTKRIVGITQNEYMPFDTYFKTLEELLSSQPFDIQEMDFDGDKITINALLKNDTFNVMHLEKENFQAGFSFSNCSQKSSVSPYVHRLICTNGMIGDDTKERDSISFGNGKCGGGKTLDHFFRGLDDLSRNKFVPKSFCSNVMRANNFKASYNEIKNATNLLIKQGGLPKNLIDNYIPINPIRTELFRRGININNITPKQEKTIKSNLSIWDVVNGLTDFASHDYGFNLTPSVKREIQTIAYNLLSKPTYDTENMLGISLN